MLVFLCRIQIVLKLFQELTFLDVIQTDGMKF